MFGIKTVINVPRNKAIILRRKKSEKASNNGILKLSKGKKARRKPSVLATAPAFPVTGANKDLTIHLKT
jgi:co-chaperonin GroES (HSP10)